MQSELIVEEATRMAEMPLPEAARECEPEKATYGQILKSSALVGGSSVLNIAVGIFRTKAMAVLLGPAGVGLLSVYGSVVTLSQTVAGMGVNSSGVRQIAEAAGSGDLGRIAQVTIVLRRTSIVLGLLGAVIVFAFARQISGVTFGDRGHAGAVSVLSIAVFLGLVSGGQGALLQGTRRIADLAKMGVLGAILGTVISIALAYFLRVRGVVPSLIATACATTLMSWWYSRRVRVDAVSLPAWALVEEAGALLKMGMAFMVSGLMSMGVAYVIRITVLRKVGVEGTGLYQSAWTLGGLYVGFILQAMGADFYPRLAARAKDDVACNRLVNEQALIGLLLAGPGVLATLTCAPLVISLCYSAKFAPAVGILRWICLGTLIQVVTWPMGFIVIAKARQGVFVGCELAWAVASLLLAWLCISKFGLEGVGIAFFGSYIFHGFMIYAVVRRMSGYRWSAANRCHGVAFCAVLGIVFCGFLVLPFSGAEAIGMVATVASGLYSLRTISELLTTEEIPEPVRRLLGRFGLLRVLGGQD